MKAEKGRSAPYSFDCVAIGAFSEQYRRCQFVRVQTSPLGHKLYFLSGFCQFLIIALLQLDRPPLGLEDRKGAASVYTPPGHFHCDVAGVRAPPALARLNMSESVCQQRIRENPALELGPQRIEKLSHDGQILPGIASKLNPKIRRYRHICEDSDSPMHSEQAQKGKPTWTPVATPACSFFDNSYC